ncbi:MAG: hypothetical protein ISR58_19495 [Anaerolineales bacterium]|nr:hypothetical protein [Anaerolineales bacterium]
MVTSQKNRSKRNKSILLAFDTLEVLAILASDEKKDPAGQNVEDVGEWLFDRILPNLKGSIYILLAGRARPIINDRYINCLDRKYWNVRIIPKLRSLNPDECKEYLETVASSLFKEKRVRGSRNIQRYIEHYGSQPLFMGTNGRPLRLAIVADILQCGGRLPEIFYKTGEIDLKNGDDANSVALDEPLIQHLAGLRTPLGEILRTLGYLRKGANSKLIKVLIGIKKDFEEDESEGAKDEVESTLKNIRNLAIVKYREGEFNRPFFLHDEIFDLFEKYRPLNNSIRSVRFEVLKKYYDYRRTTLLKFLFQVQDDLYKRKYQSEIRVIGVELLHYAFWAGMALGFEEYFLRMTEAIENNNPSPFLLIKNEIARSFDLLAIHDRIEHPLSDHIDCSQRIFEAYRLLMHSGPQAAADSLANLMSEVKNMSSFNRAFLSYLNGVYNIKTGEFRKAENLMNQLSAEIDETEKVFPDIFRAGLCLKAFVHNYQGYLHRLHGRFKEAISPYQESTAWMRKLDLAVMGGVLSNQAYAMVIAGMERNARKTIREALIRSKNQENAYYHIRARNVYAVVETRAGNPEKGIEHGQEAIKRLRLYPSRRLEGFVCVNLGRAWRYKWSQRVTENIESGWLESWRDYLIPALCYLEGDDSVKDYFGDTALSNLRGVDGDALITRGAINLLKVTSPERSSEALGEAGCIWREIAWVDRKLKAKGSQVSTTRNTTDFPSEMAFNRLKRAAGLEKVSNDLDQWEQPTLDHIESVGGNPFFPILALVNMIWHHHYQRLGNERLGKMSELVNKLVRQIYKVDELFPPPADAEVLLWDALGKNEMALCYQKLSERHEFTDVDKRNKLIQEAAWHATIALEYNRFGGRDDHHDLRRAENGLENRLSEGVDWDKVLLPSFYKGAIESNKKLVKKQEFLEDRTTRLLKVLRERFGEPELWGV